MPNSLEAPFRLEFGGSRRLGILLCGSYFLAILALSLWPMETGMYLLGYGLIGLAFWRQCRLHVTRSHPLAWVSLHFDGSVYAVHNRRGDRREVPAFSSIAVYSGLVVLKLPGWWNPAGHLVLFRDAMEHRQHHWLRYFMICTHL